MASVAKIRGKKRQAGFLEKSIASQTLIDRDYMVQILNWPNLRSVKSRFVRIYANSGGFICSCKQGLSSNYL